MLLYIDKGLYTLRYVCVGFDQALHYAKVYCKPYIVGLHTYIRNVLVKRDQGN